MNQTTDANAIFAPIWKRKWLILIVALLVAAGSYYYYERKPKIYSATTQVYLGNGAEEQQQLGGGGGGSGKKAASADPATQALLINSSIIKDAVRAHLRKEHKSAAVRAALKGKTKAKSATKSEFITINGEAHNARGAALVVNVTAQEYIKRENAHHRKEVESALSLARRQLRKIEAGAAVRASSKSKSGKSSSSATTTLQSATLSNKINQLEADLPVMEVAQVDPATRKGSKLVSPHPKTNAIFGFAIGLLLAALAAYLRGRFDRRLRTISAIESVYRTQILTALQAVRRPLVSRDGQPAPAKSLLEALWRLQTTLQVGSASTNGVSANGVSANGHGSAPRVILCVSADAGDGKSTLVAALALAMADAGERVAVVEADFRRPVQAKLLGAGGQAGLADVLNGRLTLAEALQPIGQVRAQAAVAAAPPPGATATIVESAGAVALLAGSTGVANPPALLSRPAMADLPRSLAEEFEYVLLDAPSPLQVSDVMPLLSTVDGIVIVARVGHTRENSAERLVQMLEHTPSAPVLGVVANAVSPADVQKYGLAGQQGRRWRHKLVGR
jgi:Mrp family chromosome partitioning ATPase/capsular polysaccharide biosynthesis protein